MQQWTMIQFPYLLHLFKVLSSTFYTPLHPLKPLLEAAMSLILRHCTPHCRQQQHLLDWEICVSAWDSSCSGTRKSRMGPGRDCRVDESLISPASFPETQLLHWLCGKRHCHGGTEFLAVLAASPEFLRILGGDKLLYIISLYLSSDPLAQQLPDDHSLRRKWPPFSSQHSFASWLWLGVAHLERPWPITGTLFWVKLVYTSFVTCHYVWHPVGVPVV